jgi:hypothetical protein
MKDRSSVLLITPLAIAAVFGLICKLRKQGASADKLKLIRQAVEKHLAETKAMHHTLRRQRGAINQLHQYIVPKK